MSKKEPAKLKQALIIFGLFLFWRVSLFLVAYFAPKFLAYKPSFPYADMLAQSGLPRWLYSFANFDGVHYLTIAHQGYKGVGLIQAFFPVFPFSLRFGSILTGFDYISVGLIISSLATLITLYLLNATLRVWQLNWKERLVVLVSFLALSGSLFLGAVYTEGVFLFFVWLNLYLVAKKHYFLASLVAAVASATRLTGVFLVVPVVLGYLGQVLAGPSVKVKDLLYPKTYLNWLKQLKKKDYISLLGFILIGSLGLLTYMTYLTYNFYDPLYFLHVQNEFGLGKEEKIILYPQVAWRAFKILIFARPFDLKYLTYAQEFFWGTIGLVLILLTWSLKKIPKYVLFTSLLFFFLPTAIGTFSSMSRYILPAASLPLAFLVIYQKNRFLWYLSLLILLASLIINTAMFIQGYWVA